MESKDETLKKEFVKGRDYQANNDYSPSCKVEVIEVEGCAPPIISDIPLHPDEVSMGSEWTQGSKVV